MQTCYHPDVTGSFFERVDRTESSWEPGSVASASGVSDTEAWPLSPIAGDPSALPTPTSSPISNSSARSPDARVCVPAVILQSCAFQGTGLYN